MTGTIASLNNLIYNNTTQSSESSTNQALSPEQQLAQELAQANQASGYGPPFVIDLSPASAAYVNSSANTSDIGNATSSTVNASQQFNTPQGFLSDFLQLGQALQSGNLSAAQQAFSSLSQLPGVQAAIQNNPNSPFVQEFDQIGNALQSGNVGDAQQAFASLQQQADNSTSSTSKIPHVGGHHHHHHGSGGGSEASSASAPSSSSDSDSSSSVNSLLTNINSLLSNIESDLSESDTTGVTAASDTTTPVISPNINLTA